MGNCSSTNDDTGTAHSAAIDRQIEEDSRIFRKECKILLLGKSFSFNPSLPAVRVRLWEVRSSSDAERSHRPILPLVLSSPRTVQRWSTLTLRTPINFIPFQQTMNFRAMG